MTKYTRYNIDKTLDALDDTKGKIGHRITHFFQMSLIIGAVFGGILTGALGYGMFMGILDSAPDIKSIHVGPTAYASTVLDTEGNVTAKLVQAGSNRERVTYDQLPQDLINAFVSIEDERFWVHNGIDIKSILRAVRGVVSDNSSAGGGSTITQQLIKNNVFGGGLNEGSFEKYVRKFQEQYLALELESQTDISKEELKQQIITEYLNTINLGANTLGVKVAARRYFNKEVNTLTLSECAVIAAITKNPSALNPITHPERNSERRAQVLANMLEQGYITKSQYDAAKADDVYSRIKDVDTQKSAEVDEPYSYFVDELTEQVVEELQERLGYSKEEATDMLYSGGLTIYSTQDPSLQTIVDEEVNNPENYDTEKYSITWRYTVRHADGTVVNYSEKDLIRYIKEVRGVSFNGLFKSEDTAHSYIEEYKSELLTDTDVELGEKYYATLEPQVSFVLMDQHTGQVKAISGGRGKKLFSLSLNRATNTPRQPGSTFKVISSFAPAIDLYGATLATSFYDGPYTIGEKTFKNWYSKGYLGYQTIRDGIIYSLNIIAVRCLMEQLDPHKGRLYAENLGITSLVDDDENPALALGGLTNGVTNLELTQAFATIANEGRFNKAKFFTKIVDQDGNVIIDTTLDEARQAMKPTTAFLLTDAMSQSMLPNRAFSGSINVNSTSTRAHFDGMSLAGKSGTTTKDVDIWFVGFSPYYTAGVWGGCDENQPLIDSASGEYNGGSGFHKDIWRKIMERVHEGLPDIGFEEPAGIVTAEVCRKSGMLPSSGCYRDYRGSAVITEYFTAGTVPVDTCDHHYRWGGIKVPDDESYGTDDGGYSYSDHQAETNILPPVINLPETQATTEVQQPETVEFGPSGGPTGGAEIPAVITG
ncbi:transglycosylase domain-containing protein [Oribacterium sp. WCC10]|uniref:transglycosylase domain-containing protein n=1 Tax=Oribacterium sp. WCC10 TaxID=1855343 RepID=UPI0008ED46D5|nr:transglycosylase domain-containing protein [Oribacterium sp. WCC10]SFG42256.1 penicillin-binding protein 1A [Oribacterium sp. WCC10]